MGTKTVDRKVLNTAISEKRTCAEDLLAQHLHGKTTVRLRERNIANETHSCRLLDSALLHRSWKGALPGHQAGTRSDECPTSKSPDSSCAEMTEN